MAEKQQKYDISVDKPNRRCYDSTEQHGEEDGLMHNDIGRQGASFIFTFSFTYYRKAFSHCAA